VCDFEVNIEEDVGELLSIRLYKETHVFQVDDAWYCEYVHVTSPNGKLYQFPVYHWLHGQTSVAIPHGIGRILSSSYVCIDDDDTEELEKNREVYKALEIKLKGLTKCTDSWKNLEDMKTVFYFNRTKISDEVSRIWNEDSFFGYQYLNGINPMLIKKCTKLPENFPVTSSMVASSLGSAHDLHKELQNGNVFLADYKILQGVPTNDRINGKPQYLTAPCVCCGRTLRTSCFPSPSSWVRLQENGRRSSCPVTKNGTGPWPRSGCAMQSSRSIRWSIICSTRISLQKYLNIATHRQLPRNHPVYKLVVVHLRYTLDINTIARTAFISPGGIFDKVSPDPLLGGDI
ncbi:unnamed protein product, partial [Ranitomeya imitator]